MNRSVQFLLASAVLLGGCRPGGKVKSPEDYLPFVAMALDGGATAALIGKGEAKAKKAFAACVATGVVATALNTASDAIVGVSSKSPVIPGVEVDVSDCLEFSPRQPDGREISEEMRGMLDAWTVTALQTARFYSDRLKDTDCKAYQGVLAAISYVEQAFNPVVEEVTAPDGKISLPSVRIGLASCGK